MNFLFGQGFSGEQFFEFHHIVVVVECDTDSFTAVSAGAAGFLVVAF